MSIPPSAPSHDPLGPKPELRQDLITGEWVILSPRRAQRPHQFAARQAPRPASPAFDAACPFCPGHEDQTPPPLRVIPAPDDPHHWAIRVIPNKFAALIPEGERCHPEHVHLFPTCEGVGYHEVIIDGPAHNTSLSGFTPAHMQLLVHTWRERYRALRADTRIRHMVLFKNHGPSAGASLRHPHTQIMAIPVVSAALQARHARARNYFETHRQCLFCTLLQAELVAGRRVIAENTHHVAYQPYAVRFPFEIWIVPRVHQPCFSQATDDVLAHLAHLLQDMVRRLEQALGDPDYNLVLQTVLATEDEPSYHWHVQIIPRLFNMAGFELGTGMAINTALPEETVAFLRGDSMMRGV